MLCIPVFICTWYRVLGLRWPELFIISLRPSPHERAEFLADSYFVPLVKRDSARWALLFPYRFLFQLPKRTLNIGFWQATNASNVSEVPSLEALIEGFFAGKRPALLSQRWTRSCLVVHEDSWCSGHKGHVVFVKHHLYWSKIIFFRLSKHFNNKELFEKKKRILVPSSFPLLCPCGQAVGWFRLDGAWPSLALGPEEAKGKTQTAMVGKWNMVEGGGL